MSASSARRRVWPLVLVGAGGFVGATLRYGMAVALPTAVVGTLVVNVAGSFALSVVLADALSAEARLVVATGFLSSFTTYSAAKAESVALPPRLALANVAANYALDFLAVVLGQVVARWLS